LQQKKDELAQIPESNHLNYEYKLYLIERDINKIMEEIISLKKPWYRTNTGSLNESIAQKFARLLKG